MDRHPSAVAIVVAIAAIMACYVLSVGPAVALADREVISIKTLSVVYAPVLAVCRHGQARQLLLDYCEFWTGKAFSYPLVELLVP